MTMRKPSSILESLTRQSDEESLSPIISVGSGEPTTDIAYDAGGQLIQMDVAPTPPPPPPVIKTSPMIASIAVSPLSSEKLNEAASVIIAQFPPLISEYILELTDLVLHIPRWHLVAGALLAQYEQGNLMGVPIDPLWGGEVIDPNRKSECEWCHKLIEDPKKMLQRFHQECGISYNREQADKRRKERENAASIS